MHYNLLTEHWIPVLYHDGTYDRIGIRKALSQAGKIRQIAASNPMDRVAVLRFLLAVLMWCKEDAKSSFAALDEKSAGIPENWLTKLERHKAAFNLLGDGPRFYQDASLQGEKSRPIGDLLVEFPTETKITHFCHVRDMEYGLCPACCALGIIRFCSWANAYGGGRYTSAVNGPTPAYAISHDTTLLRIFYLNCPESMPSIQKPPWLCNYSPQEHNLDFVTVFAWRSRKLWLADPQDHKDRCAYCGETDNLINEHVFTGNWKPPFKTSGNDKKFWKCDPYLILVDNTQSSGNDDDAEESDDITSTEKPQPRSGKRGQPKQTMLGFPSPNAKVATHTRFWRRVLYAKLTSNTTDNEAVCTSITGPAANKGLYQDATSFCIPRDCQLVMIETVNKAVENLNKVLRSSTTNPDRQHPERKAALDVLSPMLEASLKQELNACQEPENFLKDRLQPVVQYVVSTTTPGSPLRRRAAQNEAQILLNKMIEELVEKLNQPSDADTPAAVPDKPTHGRTMGERK